MKNLTKKHRIIAFVAVIVFVSAGFSTLLLTGCESPANDITKPNDTKTITAFSFTSPAATGTIDETAKTISVNLPYGINVTGLTPAVTHTGISISPDNEPQDFTSPVTYTVTAADNSTQAYVVTVVVSASNAKAITAFAFTNPATTGIIDEAEKTINVTVPFGTNVTSLTPALTHTGVSISPDNEPQNFTSPITYTVTAADNSTQAYVVTVAAATPSNAKAITAFAFTSPATTGIIDEAAKTISVTVPFGTNVTSLTPTFTHTGVSVSPDNEPQDFTSQVTYMVTAEDGSTQAYMVTVTVASPSDAKAITAFAFPSPVATGTIDEAAKTIDVTIHFGANVTSLTPEITVSAGASYSPSGAQNFTGPVTYTVTAEDGSTQTYKITVVIDDVITSIEILNAYFDGLPDNTAADPYLLPMRIDLGYTSTAVSGWRDLLEAIEAAGKFANLDLSSSNALHAEFNANNGIAVGKAYIVSMKLPDTSTGVIRFGAAFQERYFTNLTAISGAGITSIGNEAFYGCASLTSVDFPLVTSIGNQAFYVCANLADVDFPLVTSIGNSAFMGCTSLTGVDFPLVTSIGTSVFRNCTSLVSADFPLVTSINGSGVFTNCPNLTSVNIPLLTNIGNSTFSSCTSLVSVDFPLVTSIGDYAFSGCTSLAGVDFPLVTSIGNYAFSGCTSLAGVDFPLVTSIGNYAFSGCTSLAGVDFPLVTSIGDSAFRECTSLVSVDFPEVTSIVALSINPGGAFIGCTSLIDVNFPKLTIVRDNTFSGCTSLANVNIPLATNIYNDVFRGCTSLANVNAPSVINISQGAFTNTGTTGLTITLGPVAPIVFSGLFTNITATKNVTVRVPAGATGYTGFPPTNTTAQTWANAFRGMGWNGTIYYGSQFVNANINLMLQTFS